jgi:flagellar hook-length control protein FliK
MAKSADIVSREAGDGLSCVAQAAQHPGKEASVNDQVSLLPANEIGRAFEPALKNPTSPEGKGGSEPILSPPEERDLLHHIGSRVIWSVKNGEERIKLELDPPRLGNLYVEIHRREDTIQAILWTTSSGTKEILDSHRAELETILKQDGFQLGQFDVLVNPNMRSFQDQNGAQREPPRWAGAPRETFAALSPLQDMSLSDRDVGKLRRDQHIDLFI